MLKRCFACAILWACISGGALHAQAPARVDFKTDVQPIFKANCIGCHGPKQQKNGFRLDRRKDAMRGGTIPVIGPGNSAGSRLYLKLVGSEFGPQMPPTGALKTEQINIIKAWIDQGAEWPDDASGEIPLPPPDPGAAGMMEAIRNGDHRAFDRMLKDDRAHVNLKGPGGSTPLMYAALYGDADCVRRLLASRRGPQHQERVGRDCLDVGDRQPGEDATAHRARSRRKCCVRFWADSFADCCGTIGLFAGGEGIARPRG